MNTKFSEKDKKKYETAKKHSSEGNLSELLVILKELVIAYPSKGLLRGMLANTYWDLGNFKMAEIEFKLAVKSAPNSEKVSLGLFHFYLEQSKDDEAFLEAKRFLKNSNSKEYEKFFKDINNSQ